MTSPQPFRRLPASAEPYRPDRPPPPARSSPPSTNLPRAIADRLAPPRRASTTDRRPALRAAAGTATAVIAVLVIVWACSGPVLGAVIDALRWLESHNGQTGRAIVTVAVVAGGALALVMAWSRATAPRRPVRLAGGHGTISVDALELRLEELWLERPDVIAARAAVENRHRHGIMVAARIAVTADARLHDTAKAAAWSTEMFVEGQLGVDLAAPPRFALSYRELDLRAGRA